MGPDCVERLNGDFAFAIWDARRRQLMLARDRMGVRPLFYAQRGGALYFASEVKALLQVPGIEAELDPIALDQIFTFWFPLAPRTIFKGVSELPPAHVLVARDGERLGAPLLERSTFPTPTMRDARRAQRGRDRGRGARASDRRDAHPPALRRAGRLLSLRRARFLARRGDRRPARARAAAHLLGPLRQRRSSTRPNSSSRWPRRSAPTTARCSAARRHRRELSRP